MKDQLLSQIIPLLITFIVGVFAAIIKTIGDAIISLVQSKEKEVLQRIDLAHKQDQVKEALNVWQIVDEHFRINKAVGDAIQLKIAMFNDLLLKKIPGLTQEQIDFLRQSVAGEVNKGKIALQTPLVQAESSVSNPVSSSDQETIKEMHDQIPKEVSAEVKAEQM